MKKILFRKLLNDCIIFFLVTIISATIIVWVFQSVNYLDIIVEDGRDYLTYLSYSLLNLPKIFSKILPFSIFFSFFYVIAKYELNNELITLWNFGVHKLSLINFFLFFSCFILIFQLVLTSYIVPNSQKLSRSLIKGSNIDFFENFIKPKKFNDNIKGLTIYVDKKDEKGNLQNIYLKKENDDGNFQITYAKSGYFSEKSNSKVLVLQNGETLNKINENLNNFSFNSSEFLLSQFDADIITVYKLQETLTTNLLKCTSRFIKIFEYFSFDDKIIIQNCTTENYSNVLKELYKRLIVPFYLPILIIISSLLIIYSKENINYLKFRIVIFLFGFFMIIFSETTLSLIKNSYILNLILITIPILILAIIYYLVCLKLNYKINKM